MGDVSDRRGQVLPLVALVVVLTGMACLWAGQLGGAAVARAQAATAADAAALAGAARGRVAAWAAAADNGGRLARYQEVGADTEVEVVVGGARAIARARRSGDAGGPGADVAPALRAALARAAQLLGSPVPLEAPPARPRPRRGRPALRLSVEVAPAAVPRLLRVGPQAGLCPLDAGGGAGRFGLCPPRPRSEPRRPEHHQLR